jgi:hypothetical protein
MYRGPWFFLQDERMEVLGFFYRMKGWRSLVFLQDERMGMMGRIEVFGFFTDE